MVEATFQGARGERDIHIQLLPEGKGYERAAGYLVVDGVSCSPEVLRAIIVSPDPNRLLSIHRSGDHVELTVHVRQMATPEENELREMERGFAYEMASGMVESHCVLVARDGAQVWWDLQSAETDITDETHYLESRGLLDHHPDHPHWVSLRDEAEPLPTATKAQVA